MYDTLIGAVLILYDLALNFDAHDVKEMQVINQYDCLSFDGRSGRWVQGGSWDTNIETRYMWNLENQIQNSVCYSFR
jgi:hypothetical protein